MRGRGGKTLYPKVTGAPAVFQGGPYLRASPFREPFHTRSALPPHWPRCRERSAWTERRDRMSTPWRAPPRRRPHWRRGGKTGGRPRGHPHRRGRGHARREPRFPAQSALASGAQRWLVTAIAPGAGSVGAAETLGDGSGIAATSTTFGSTAARLASIGGIARVAAG